MKRLAVLFNQLGPYHVARLNALQAGGHFGDDVVVIELARQGSAYAWNKVETPDSFRRVTLLEDGSPHIYNGRVVARLVERALEREQPPCVAIPNWASSPALSALNWCQKAGVPAVVMTDSQACDRRRTFVGESIKKRIVRLFSTGLAAGKPHAEYLRRLGMMPERIFNGCDVVDNRYFAEKADAARASAEDTRRRLRLPEKYFLASNRFVPKKNLLRMLEAYARYRIRAGSEAWKLVMLGNGELKAQIEKRRHDLGLEMDVLMHGFQQIDALPAYYGLASCFVHASTVEQWGLVVNEAMAAGLPVLVSNRCGCVADLVKDGCNGFSFDPYDTFELADHMRNIAAGQHDPSAMGRASRRIISRWSPQKFATNLWRAVDVSMGVPRPKAPAWDRAMLWALARR